MRVMQRQQRGSENTMRITCADQHMAMGLQLWIVNDARDRSFSSTLTAGQ